MEITPDLITQFGLISKVSTGHAYLDMIVVMLVPVLIRSLLPWITELWNTYINRQKPPKQSFTRIVEHKKVTDYWWYDNDGPSQKILQSALLNYINTHGEVLRELPSAELQIKNKAQTDNLLNLTGDDYEEEVNAREQEHSYDVNVAPPDGVWIDLRNGIKFMCSQEALDDKNKNMRIKYHLLSEHPQGNTKIDEFVQEALELYRKQQASKVDYSRYLYIPILTGWAARAASTEEGGSKSCALYKRYKLSEEKTFASFFHPDKEGIVQLVEQFLNKKGKFSIAGYPQKLGFLLYGPPGTGKTSFIKALAQHTKRSVISIPLTKIRTNQELMDIMMDQKVKIEGDDSAISLPYSKTIFVMEDVDAASDVVQRRVALPPASVMAAMAAVGTSTPSSASKGKADKEKADKDGSDDDKDDGGKKKPMGPMLPGAGMGRSMWGGDDDLNLAGLLNVLDGVVDTPNRIVIMTTNHPEKLDPALIRPGRINRRIYMGRICVNECLQMMNHYFGSVPESVQAQLRAVFVDEALSPAEVETMCADFASPQELVDHLANKFSFALGAGSTSAATSSQPPPHDPYVKTF